MLSVNYAECCRQVHYAAWHYAECRYAECRYTECRGVLRSPIESSVTLWRPLNGTFTSNLNIKLNFDQFNNNQNDTYRFGHTMMCYLSLTSMPYTQAPDLWLKITILCYIKRALYFTKLTTWPLAEHSILRPRVRIPPER
jgi:hypothetical protein